MPTRKQLSSIWETQFEFFGGFGQPKANYTGTAEGTSEGNGLTTERFVETPTVPEKLFDSFAGEEIGDFKLDPTTGDLKIIINLD